MIKREFSADEARTVMTVPGDRRVYVINCGKERRLSTMSQQVRAYSLVGSIFDSPGSTPPQSLCIIGAGVAGVTAACLAASRSCRVTVLEKQDRALSTYESSPITIHPHFYEWPFDSWSEPRANLSLLDWGGQPGRSVTDRLRAQWSGWLQMYPEQLELQVGCAIRELVTSPSVRPRVRWASNGSDHDEDFDAVILAIGFGPERFPADLPLELKRPYFLGRTPIVPGERVFISGAGDGGLAESIYFATGLDEGALASKLGDLLTLHQVEAEKFESELLDADDGDADVEVDKWCRSQDWCDDLLETEIARWKAGGPSAVVLVGLKPAPGTYGVYPINRLLITRLQVLGAITYLSTTDRGLTIVPDPKSKRSPYRIAPPGGTPAPEFEAPFQRVLVRNGPQLRLPQDFSEINALLPHRPSVDTGFRIARREAPPARERILYSDLFDSVTQREVWEAVDDQSTFMALYENRLRLELCRSDKIVLSDNQWLDGDFFTRWLGDPRTPGTPLWTALKGRLVLRCRKANIVEQYRTFYWDDVENRPTGVEVSSLHEHRYVVKDLLKDVPTFTHGPPSRCTHHRKEANLIAVHCLLCLAALQSWLETIVTDAAAQAEVVRMFEAKKRLADALPKLEVRVETRPSTRVAFERLLRDAADDPGLFLDNLQTDAARNIVVPILDAKRLSRSNVFDRLDQAKEDIHDENVHRDLEKIRSWYQRGYLLAVGRQQGATVFETTYVEDEGDWHWKRSKPTHKTPSRPLARAELKAASSADLASIRAVSSPVHLAQGARVAPAGDRSARLYQLMSGQDHVERRSDPAWQIAGAKIPAGIDAEFINSKIVSLRKYEDPFV